MQSEAVPPYFTELLAWSLRFIRTKWFTLYHSLPWHWKLENTSLYTGNASMFQTLASRERQGAAGRLPALLITNCYGQETLCSLPSCHWWMTNDWWYCLKITCSLLLVPSSYLACGLFISSPEMNWMTYVGFWKKKKITRQKMPSSSSFFTVGLSCRLIHWDYDLWRPVIKPIPSHEFQPGIPDTNEIFWFLFAHPLSCFSLGWEPP